MMVIGDVAGQDAAKVSLAQDEDMVEALATNRTNQALGDGLCPGLCGAVRTFSICMRFTRWRKCWP